MSTRGGFCELEGTVLVFPKDRAGGSTLPPPLNDPTCTMGIIE